MTSRNDKRRQRREPGNEFRLIFSAVTSRTHKQHTEVVLHISNCYKRLLHSRIQTHIYAVLRQPRSQSCYANECIMRIIFFENVYVSQEAWCSDYQIDLAKRTTRSLPWSQMLSFIITSFIGKLATRSANRVAKFAKEDKRKALGPGYMCSVLSIRFQNQNTHMTSAMFLSNSGL